jgi:hypothetical protein
MSSGYGDMTAVSSKRTVYSQRCTRLVDGMNMQQIQAKIVDVADELADDFGGMCQKIEGGKYISNHAQNDASVSGDERI